MRGYLGFDCDRPLAEPLCELPHCCVHCPLRLYGVRTGLDDDGRRPGARAALAVEGGDGAGGNPVVTAMFETKRLRT